MYLILLLQSLHLSPGTCTSSTQQNISRSTSSSVLINTSVSQAINTSTDSSNIPQPVSVQLDTPIPDPINTSPLISNPADLTNRWLQAPNPSSNSIHLFYWNCRSISNKLPFFQSFIYSSTIHIFALSETWLSDKIYSKEILPSGYNIYRSDRHTRGGGVLIGVSSSLSSHLIASHSSIDMVVVQLLTSPPITLCCTYIPPSCSPDYFSSCISALTTIMTHHQNVIILGDFNLPDIDWSCLTSHSPFSDLLCDFIFQYNLTQLLLNSTHSKGNILDLLITNSDHRISNLHITPCSENLFSDHLFIFFDLLTNYHPPQQTFSYSLDFSKGDFDAFNDYLLEFDFSFCNSMDIDSAWNHLKSILSIGCSRYIPKIRINSHRPPKWFNSDIRNLLNRVHSLRRKVNRSPTPYLSENYPFLNSLSKTSWQLPEPNLKLPYFKITPKTARQYIDT